MALSEWFLQKLGELGLKIAQEKIKKLARDKSKPSGVDQFQGLQLNVSGKNNNVVVNYVASVEALKQSKQLVDRRGSEFIALAREDLAFFEGEMLTPNEQWLEIFRQFKGYVSETQMAALKAAVTICRLEDRGFTAEALKRKTEFNQHFRHDGRQIYNMVRSKIFHEWILPAFVMRRFVEKDVGESQRIFREFFDAVVNNMPWAIFVGKFMEPEQLRSAIDARLSDEKVTTVAIFTRGSRLKKMAHDVLKSVKKALRAAEREYNVEVVNYQLAEGSACVQLLEVETTSEPWRKRKEPAH